MASRTPWHVASGTCAVFTLLSVTLYRSGCDWLDWKAMVFGAVTVFPVVFRRVYLVCDLKDDLWLGRILSTFLKHCLPTFERTAWYMPTMLVYWHRFHLVLCSCSVGINGIDDNRMRCILFTMKGPKAMITLTKKKFAAKWIPTLRKVWPSF